MTSVKLIKFLDKYLGSLLCLILSINKLFYKKNSRHKKIMIIQLWGLGETILSLPAIKILKNNYKKSSIDVLTTKRVNDIFYDNKQINKIKILNLNPFSIVYFIINNFRKWLKPIPS